MIFEIDQERYNQRLEYEVFCECITNEMAWHGARLDETGDDTEEGRTHYAEMISLKKLRDSVRVRDESTLKRARQILDDMKTKRQSSKSAVA